LFTVIKQLDSIFNKINKKYFFKKKQLID